MRVTRVHRTPSRSVIAVTVVAVVALAHSVAYAQSRPANESPAATIAASDRAVAEALFDQALESMKGGDYAAACAKFAESQRLDPSAGTAFNLARCYQVTKRLASAWASFRQAASIARSQRNEELVQIASQAADVLEPQLAKLSIAVPLKNRVAGQRIARDGWVVNASLWGEALPVDGGTHMIEVRAPGHHPWSTTVTVPNEPIVVTVKVPALVRAPADELPQPQSPPSTSGSFQTLPSSPAYVDESGSTQRTVAYVVGGIGAATVGVGVGVGIWALVQNEASNDHCGEAAGLPHPNDCSAEGKLLRDEAQRAGRAAIGLLVAGGVVGGVGLTLYLTAPAEADERARRRSATGRVSLRVRATPGGMALQGRW